MAPYGSPWANIFLKLSQLKNVREDACANVGNACANIGFGPMRPHEANPGPRRPRNFLVSL